jgi:CO dehydrogenase maturation factor
MHATVRSVIEMASEAAEDVCILDTEASPEHLSRGTAAYADLMLLVVEPYFKSLETGRRMAALAKDLGLERVALIANKVRDDGDLAAVKEFAERNGLEIGGVIPFDERMREAEQLGQSPLDYDAEGPAVKAIKQVARDVVGSAPGGNGALRGGNGASHSS